MPDPAFTVAVTGSMGMIGSALVPYLMGRGHRVVRLVRRETKPPADGTTSMTWDPSAKSDAAAFAGIDALIHLAGANIAERRWNAERKRVILESRSIPTRRLAEAAAEWRPQVFLCASAAGYYGDRGDEELTEDSPPGTGFFPDVCKAWEAATEPARAAGVRTVNMRFGPVLNRKEGVLGKQLLPFKLGLGAVLGSGRQWISWIALSDAVAAIHHCLVTGAVDGPVNLVAPGPVRNREFTKTLGRVLSRPAFMWLPRFALRVLFGEIADEALLSSTRALPRKLLATGFTFAHPQLADALRFELQK
jgi:uncharacterized protein